MRVVLAVVLCVLSAPCGAATVQSPPTGPGDATAAADSIPLPPPRPQPNGLNNLGVPTMGAGPEPQPPSACFRSLTSGIAVAEPLPPIALPNGCDALDVVELDAVMVGGRRVAVTPPATLRCSLATSVATWLREDVMPAVASLGAPLAGGESYGSFECRGRKRVVGAKTSEHGRADALDLRALLLGNGRRVQPTDPDVARALREDLRSTACTRFTTVLGPGSDGYHEEHIHVDLIERRNGYRICQWDVRDASIPLPRPRPAEAPPRAAL